MIGTMKTSRRLVLSSIIVLLSFLLVVTEGLVPISHSNSGIREGAAVPTTKFVQKSTEKPLEEKTIDDARDGDDDGCDRSAVVSRRSVLSSSMAMVGAGVASSLFIQPEGYLSSSPTVLRPANAAVGTLPEFANTNAIIQGVTVNVADKSQQDAMINFLTGAFDFQVLRKRIQGSVEDTWLGYGPEQLSIPSDFELPVSSFAKYGGHASIHIRFDNKAMAPLYRIGDDPTGNNIEFIQVGVPGYRISEMVKNGGKIIDAYGFVNVVSPCGVKMRGLVGISPDPLMFVAINCEDVQKSKAFYEQLGFVEQEYPFCRLSKGQTPFEPAQPRNSAYMAPTSNGFGILLLPVAKKKVLVTPNPAFGSLNVVYTPPEGSSGANNEESEIVDLSGVPIRFQSADKFSSLEKATR